MKDKANGLSSKGRTADFGSENEGSNPSGPTKKEKPEIVLASPVAQWLEQWLYMPKVAGSNPVTRS